jgi:hypothetical protein
MKKLFLLPLFFLFCFKIYCQNERYSKDSLELEYKLFLTNDSIINKVFKNLYVKIFSNPLNTDSLIVHYFPDSSIYTTHLYKNNALIKYTEFYLNGQIRRIDSVESGCLNIMNKSFKWFFFNIFGDIKSYSTWVQYYNLYFRIAIEFDYENSGFTIAIYNQKNKKIGIFKSYGNILIEDFAITNIRARKVLKMFLIDSKYSDFKLRPRTKNAVLYRLFKIVPKKPDSIEFFDPLYATPYEIEIYKKYQKRIKKSLPKEYNGSLFGT